MFQLYILIAAAACVWGAPQDVLLPLNILPNLDGRIVGGNPTTIFQYPYQVSLQLYGRHICGGSIIGSKYVVTAAHCTDGSSAGALSIRAGSTIKNTGGVGIKVAKIHQHGQYNSRTVDYDISVLVLAQELSFSTSIQPVPLPTRNLVISTGAKAVCTGWGSLKEGGSSPELLQEVVVSIIGNSQCKKDYKGFNDITDRMVCAGANGGGKDACQGDSGGPLVVGGQLIGVVSWGYGCARPSYPGVYASVPNLRDHILQKTGI